MPKISIIIPAYKAENTLSRTIDSLLNQTFQDFEIIIVDDGSPDKTGMIADDIASHDERIKVIHQTNGGPLEARKSGHKLAMGDYRMHLDSDDTLTKEALNTMFLLAETYNLDYLLSGFNRITPNKTHECPLADKFSVMNCRQVIDLLLNPNFQYVGCMCFSRKELWEHIDEILPTFAIQLPGEDIIANFRLAVKSKNIGIIDRPLYNYYYNANSLTSLKTFFKQDLVHAFFNEIENILDSINILDEVRHQLDVMKLHFVGFYVPNVNKRDPWIGQIRSIPKDQISFKYKILQILLCNNKLRRRLLAGYRWIKSVFGIK